MVEPVRNEFRQVKNTPEKAAGLFAGYFQFAVIRDPVSRMVSNYKMFCLSGNAFRNRQIEALFDKPHDRIAFEEFIRLAAVYKNHHWEQLAAFLPFSGQGEATVMLDVVLETGRLEAGWRDVARALGIESVLGRKNSTGTISMATDIAPEAIKCIEEKYKGDMLLMQKYA